MKRMNCKNCGQIVEGKFCSQCGQNSNIDKVNLATFSKEISNSLLQIDNGFFYTLTELFIRPGNSILEYLNGKRKSHFKPFAYVLTLSTLYYFLSRFVGENTWMSDLVSGLAEGALDLENSIEMPTMLFWISKNFAYATLLFIPISSFASYISFSGFGRNYLEHIVLNSYIVGQQAIFYSIFILFKSYSNSDYLEIIPVTISICYAFWVFWQFFKEGNRISNIFRSIITYLLYFIFSSILLFIPLAIQEL